jgi:selenocysteine lyase/cysteine desulfurase
MADSPLWHADFGPFEGHIWLNAAHQGAMPKVAARAASRMVQQRLRPYEISDESFNEVPERLRREIARFINADPNEIVLGNSASYGLDLLAKALPFQPGDEILLVEGEFPASVLPWRVCEQNQVRVRLMSASNGFVPTAAELASELSNRTRVFCTSWVNSLSGHAADVEELGKVCRSRGVIFVVNGSQAVGARTVDITGTGADALVCCGYKWLLGPYGTGFAWISEKLQKMLRMFHAYWLPNVWGKRGLKSYDVDPQVGIRAYDIFGTANFLNFVPWAESLAYLSLINPRAMEVWIRELIEYAARQLDPDRWEVLLPHDPKRRSSLLFVRPKLGNASEIHRHLQANKIHVSLREGLLRLSPHIYNTAEEVARALDVMNGF